MNNFKFVYIIANTPFFKNQIKSDIYKIIINPSLLAMCINVFFLFHLCFFDLKRNKQKVGSYAFMIISLHYSLTDDWRRKYSSFHN